MSLPIDVEKAIADEKDKRGYGNEQDLAELIEKTKAAPPAEVKEEVKEEKKEPEATKPDSKVATDLLNKRLGFTRKTKKEPDEKKEDAPDDKLETVEAEPEGTKTPDATGAGKDDKAKTKAKIAKKPDIDPIEIATAAAARTAQTFMESHAASREKVADAGVAKGIEDNLSDDEKGELEVFKEMAKDARFKELPRQYVAYLKKAEDYQREWEKAHPTEEFDPEGNDHDSFYAKHQPKYSELEYKKAIVRMESKGPRDKELEDLRSEQKRLKADAAARDLDPIINQTSVNALAEVIKGFDENILTAIQKEGFDKYSAANEVEADLIKEAAARLGPFITGILQFDDPEGRIPFNEKNPAHMEAVRYLRQKEDEIKKMPTRERVTDDGKVIVPRAEFFQMSNAAKAAHTYLDTQMLLQMRIAEEAEKAKTQYQKELKKAESRAKALGWVPPSSKKNGQEHKEVVEEIEEEVPEKKVESKSPEASSSSRVDTSGDVKTKATKDSLDLTADILFSRR